MAPGVDPQLPRRLRALAAIRAGEQRVARAWFGAVSTFLDRVRPAAMAPSAAGQAPDASEARSNADVWRELVDADVVPEIADLFRNPYGVITDADPDVDPYAISYLRGVRNRLQGVPDQVYSLIVAEVERGIREGRTIPEISEAVQQVLTASATPYWRNRAVTVARTETIGATNAGAYAGAVQRVMAAGDGTAQKVWVSTVGDDRTRPSHREADTQRVPLLETFTVGGAGLQFPGDPSGPAQEVVNCRCTLIVTAAGEELDWTNRQFLGRGE